MTHACTLIWSLAGKPPVEGANASLFTGKPGICCVTGLNEDNTAPANRVLGGNFTDRTMFNRPDSPLVGYPAAAILSGGGKRTIRQWTVVATPNRALPPSQEKASDWLDDHYGLCLTSKRDTTPIIDTLWDPPEGEWLVSVAESAQKHVVPYAKVNEGHTGIIRYETLDVPYQRDQWREVFTSTLGLRRLGIPSADILTGHPRYLKTRNHLTQWQTLNQQLEGWHNSPLLRLALWTITKGITENDTYPR